MRENAALAESYRHCRKIARAAARNFYYGFLLLPGAKRDALCALYAFMRGVDDIADEPGTLEAKQRGLREHRAEMDRALAGQEDSNPIWPAFRHTVASYGIPPRYLHDLLSGAEMDLSIASYATFESLREYCYRVAGTVGLCCLHVFGFHDAHAPEFAEKLGIAFQLTNILRDLQSDFAMGRVYLPKEDFERFACQPEQIGQRQFNTAFLSLIRFEAKRAEDFYREGWKLIDLVDQDSRAALWALASIYSGILEKIRRRGDFLLNPAPARLSTAEKLWILARARLGWLRQKHGFEISDRDWRGIGRTGRRDGAL